MLRLLGTWLHAGVLESGALSYPDKGTPQGGVVSPILANVFLHYVLDEWFVKTVQPRMQGGALSRVLRMIFSSAANEKLTPAG